MLQKYNALYVSDFNVCAKRVTFVPETTKTEIEAEKIPSKINGINEVFFISKSQKCLSLRFIKE